MKSSSKIPFDEFAATVRGDVSPAMLEALLVAIGPKRRTPRRWHRELLRLRRREIPRET